MSRALAVTFIFEFDKSENSKGGYIHYPVQMPNANFITVVSEAMREAKKDEVFVDHLKEGTLIRVDIIRQ